MRWLLALLVAAGCATAPAGADRHAAAPIAQPPWAVDAIFLRMPRAGQLAASREWERGGDNRVVTYTDDAILRMAFNRALTRVLPIDPGAPRHLRVTLVQQDTGYFEGFAAEAADVSLIADILDADGRVVDSITLREAASAPLQRSASREHRLASAFDRLADRLARRLAEVQP